MVVCVIFCSFIFVSFDLLYFWGNAVSCVFCLFPPPCCVRSLLFVGMVALPCAAWMCCLVVVCFCVGLSVFGLIRLFVEFVVCLLLWLCYVVFVRCCLFGCLVYAWFVCVVLCCVS